VVNSKPDLTITDPVAVCAPNTIDLTNAAVTAGSTTYGGTLAYFTDAEATSAYATPAVADSNAYYIVVSTGASCADTVQVNAVVNPTPTISSIAENSPSGCGLSDGSIIFSGLSSTTDYLLSYNSTVDSLVKSDASGDIKLLNLTSGNYINIAIKGIVGSCSDATADITLLEPNIPFLAVGAAQEVCEGEFVTLSATTNGGSTISWDNSVVDGITFQPGVGAMKYTVTIDSNSCVTTDSIMVTVHGKPDLIITDPVAVCAPNTIDLTDAAVTSGSTTYGATLTYYTDAGATSAYATPATANSGAYFVVASTGAGCSDTAQINAFIKAGVFIASVTGGNLSGCGLNDGTITIGGLIASTNYLLSYNATVDSALTSNSSGEIVLLNLLNGVYSGIDVRESGGCFNDTRWEVTLVSPDKPFVNAGTALEVCEGEFVILSATINSATSVSWDNSVLEGVAFQPGVGAIKYTVTADSSSCITIDSVTVTVHPKPNLTITAPATVCAPSMVDITDAAITAGSSDLGRNSYYTDATLSALVTNATSVGAGTYSIVTETDKNCRDTAVVNVTVSAGGSGIAAANANCDAREVDLTAIVSGTDVTFSQWLVSSDSINYSVSSSLDNFTVPAVEEAWYIAEFTTTELCIGRDTIYVSACPKLPIVIADVMTPNGDGDNDIWWVKNIELFANNEVIIYNRWGSEVYRASGYNNDWDGTFNGKPLPIGAYYYTLEFNDEEGTNYQGVINLMR
jgi:gliding motility-associated-like protein